MKLEKLDRIRVLNRQANALKGFFTRFNNYVLNKSSCDKHGASFNADARFSNFKVHLSFDSWKGYYGNSVCSTAGPSLTTDDAQQYFVKAVNAHRALLFDTMAELMAKDAAAMREQAEKEIEAARELLDSLDAEPETDQDAA